MEHSLGMPREFVETHQRGFHDSMPTRSRRSPLASTRSTTPPTAGPMFPRAVAGEQYARYAKSVWTHAQRWLTSHWIPAARGAATEMDARLKLRALAATDLNRHLNEQEE